MKGFVQGVFYRVSVRKVALDLGLKGFVRNLSDGNVEVVAEGDEEKINELIEFCKEGPSGAKVEGVDVTSEKPKNEFKDFEIGY